MPASSEKISENYLSLNQIAETYLTELSRDFLTAIESVESLDAGFCYGELGGMNSFVDLRAFF